MKFWPLAVLSVVSATTSYPCTFDEGIFLTEVMKDLNSERWKKLAVYPVSTACDECWEEKMIPSLLACSLDPNHEICTDRAMSKCFSPQTIAVIKKNASKSSAVYTVGAVALLVGLLL